MHYYGIMKMVIFEGNCPECQTTMQDKEPLRNIDSEYAVSCKNCGKRFNLPVKQTV